MSKDSILDYSTTASENQDISSISTLGTAKPNVIDDIVRAQMSHIAKGLVTRRVAKDTAYTAVKADHNQMIDFTETATLTTSSAATLTAGWMCFVYASGGAVTINPNGAETVNGEESIQISEGTLGILRVYDGNFLFSSFGGGAGLPTITVYDTVGTYTHTFATGTTKFQVEGCGGGGAGGASNTTSSFTATNYGHGGHSGWFYETDILDRDAIATASITVGAGGTGTPSSQVNGGDSSYDDGTNTFSWPGGFTPQSLTGIDAAVRIFRYAQTTAPVGVGNARYGAGGFGGQSITLSGSGEGGSTPYGQGGPATTTSNVAGSAGTGHGSGGSGSQKSSGSTGYNGGAGRLGIVIIREWTD